MTERMGACPRGNKVVLLWLVDVPFGALVRNYSGWLDYLAELRDLASVSAGRISYVTRAVILAVCNTPENQGGWAS